MTKQTMHTVAVTIFEKSSLCDRFLRRSLRKLDIMASATMMPNVCNAIFTERTTVTLIIVHP